MIRSLLSRLLAVVPGADRSSVLRQHNDRLEQTVADRTAELRRANERLAQAQETAQIGSWESDKQTGEVTWSDQLYRIFGIEPDDAVATKEEFTQRIHSDDRVRIMATVEEAIINRVPFAVEYRVIWPNGEVRIVEGHGNVVCDESGALKRIFGTAQDITEQKRIRAEADRVKDEFIGTVTHELNTPLTAIISGIERLQIQDLGALSESQNRVLRVMAKNAARQARLVDDLLLANRVEYGQFSIEKNTVDLGAVVTESYDSALSLCEAHQVAVEFNHPGEVIVWGDHDRLVQLCDNLLSNALKFTPPSGIVTLSLVCRELEHEAAIRVHNTGSFVSEEDRERLFERFFRASTSTRAAVPGIGLGLAIAKAIVEAHGGSIAVESDDGGTAFSVKLPLIQQLTVPARESERIA